MKKLLLTLLVAVMSISAWAAIEDGTYELCTSTSDLVAGEHYIIASGNSGSVQCISNVSNSNNRKQVDATVTNNQIVVESNSTIMTFTLGGSTGAWTFSTDNYAGTNGYLASAASGNNNYCRVISTSTTSTVSFNNNAAVITLQPHTSRNILRYNSSSSCFACYSTGQGAVYLYKKATSADPVDASWSVSPASVSVRATKSQTASITTNYNGTLSVASNNTSVAAATINGKVITVTGVAEGNTTLTVTGTATSKYNAISKTINVTVTPNVTTPGIYSITPNNAFWGTSYSGTISSVTANSLTLNGESDDISIQLKNGTSTNGYITDTQTRVYNGYTMKFSVPTGFDITDIGFTADAGNNWAGTHTASVGTMTNNKNWTGIANEVTITFGGNCRIEGISVQYVTHVAPTVTYTVTFNAGTNGTCSTSQLTETSAGAGVTLPEVTPNTGWDFVGWSTASSPSSANAGVAGDTYYPSAACTLYAYYTKQLPSFSGKYIDIDLSTNQTTTATENAMTWTNTFVNIAVAKAGATAATNNYYPGSSPAQSSTRFYKNSTLTFTPATGVTITGIEYTATTEAYATAFANSTWTNGDGVASTTTAYVTPTDGTQALSATIGATTGGTKFRVYYSATFDVITLNAACHDESDIVYGTYSNSSAWVVSDDIEVSEIAVIDGELWVEKYTVGAVVPANTGVMVSALEGGNYVVNLSNEAGSSVLGTDNCLRPSGNGITADAMAAADADCKYYRLTMHNGETIGFWWGAADGAAFSLAANKAYLAVPKSAGAPAQVWFEESQTVISLTPSLSEGEGACYDLYGRKSNGKGLMIQNGKVVLVK